MSIECKELVKVYQADGREFRAVDKVDFSLAPGDFGVILGHSGSGKTTLLSLIGGLAKPDSGEVFINGIENWQQTELALAAMRNNAIGFIFQFGSLIPTLTCLENIILPLSFCGKDNPPAGDMALARELLDQVGLSDKENAFPAQLSGGQQRRVAIARAFINRPGIILADEPTGDLDEETEKEILSIFRYYNTEHKTTFLVVTHNSSLAKSQQNTRIFRMKNGKLAETTGKEDQG